MERRKGYIGDIHWQKIGYSVGCCFMVLFVVTVFIIWIIYIDASENRRHQQRHNAIAEEFNDLPQDKRVFLAEWDDYEVDENCFLALEPEPSTFAEQLRGFFLPLGTIALLAILSLWTFCCYTEEKSGNYFYADYPFCGVFSRIIFALMWIGWPVLLISLVNMRCWEAQQKARHSSADSGTPTNAVLATAEVEAASSEENEGEDEDREDENVTYEDPSTHHTYCDTASCEQFIEYCQNDNIYKRKQRLARAEEKVQEIEKKLQRHGNIIRELQGDLKSAKLELEKIKAIKPLEPEDPEVLKTEWEAIKNMRGVRYICYDRRLETLFIDVAVRVPYEGEVYDFGDFAIKVHYDGVECLRRRSGVRADWRGGYPDYCHNYNDKFCLGSRETKILEFLREHRIREAIILIIDCMHSVNDEDAAREIPNCFRRIIPPKEG